MCIEKHDPKDKAVFDTKGKDSDKFIKTGANVAVISPTRTTLFKRKSSSIEEIIKLFEEFDYLLVEGLKTLPLPRIAIFRDNLDSNYFEVTDVITTDDSINKEDIPSDSVILDLNNIDEIIDWINRNGKKSNEFNTTK